MLSASLNKTLLPSFQALHYMKLEHFLIGMYGDTKVCLFYFANKDIIFGLVPSNIAIRSNEKADSAAKCFGFAVC